MKTLEMVLLSIVFSHIVVWGIAIIGYLLTSFVLADLLPVKSIILRSIEAFAILFSIILAVTPTK